MKESSHKKRQFRAVNSAQRGDSGIFKSKCGYEEFGARFYEVPVAVNVMREFGLRMYSLS